MSWRDKFRKPEPGKNKQEGASEMHAPPLTPLHHSLLGYNAQVTGDVPIMPLYTIPQQHAYHPRIGSMRDHLERWLPDSMHPLQSMMYATTPRLLEPKAQRDLLREFKTKTLPHTIIPWIRGQCGHDQFMKRCIYVGNMSMLARHNDVNAALELAGHLRDALPDNQALQKIVSPEVTRSLSINHQVQAWFFDQLQNPSTLPTLQDQKALRQALKQLFHKRHDMDNFNIAAATSPYRAAESLGFTQEQADSFITSPPRHSAPGDTPDPQLDKKALAAATEALVKHLSRSLPLQMSRNIPKAVEHIEKLSGQLRTTNMKHAPLSQPEIERVLNTALAHVPETSLAARMMRIGLANPALKIVMVGGNEVNGYWSGFNPRNFEKLSRHSIAGYSENANDRLYVSAGNDVYHATDVVVEEVLHHSFKKLYPDNSNQFTYPPDYGSPPRRHPPQPQLPPELELFDVDMLSIFIRDARKTLFLEALRSDLNNIGRKVAVMRKDLDMPDEAYSGGRFHAEAVVKIMKMKALGRWTQAHERRYHHLSQYVENVVAIDIADWEQAQAAKQPYTPRIIDPQPLRAALPPVRDRMPFPLEQPVERVSHEGKEYFVLNGDHFAVHAFLDPLEFVQRHMPGFPVTQASGPLSTGITAHETPQGVFVTIPADMALQGGKALFTSLDNASKQYLNGIIIPDTPAEPLPPVRKVEDLLRLAREARQNLQNRPSKWENKVSNTNETRIR